MQIGFDTFVATTHDPATGGDPSRVRELLEQIQLADQVGLSVVGVGEHHRPEYLSSAPAVLLAAGKREPKILDRPLRRPSSVPMIRKCASFSSSPHAWDLISNGRAEIIVGFVGRSSSRIRSLDLTWSITMNSSRRSSSCS